MTDNSYGEAVETLQLLVSGLGAGLAAWGVINLLESYDTTESDEIAEVYRCGMEEINLQLQRLFEDKTTGQITPVQYKTACVVLDDEMDALWEALHHSKREAEARKKARISAKSQSWKSS